MTVNGVEGSVTMSGVDDIYDKMIEINNISQTINRNISNITINNFNGDLQKIYDTYEEINEQQVLLNKNIKNGEKNTEGFFSKIKKAAGAFVDIPNAGDIVNTAFGYSDKINNMQYSISDMNDGVQSDAELQDKIYGASVRSRTDMGDVTETAGNLSSIGFSNDEAVQFTENLNKLFAIAGTGQEAQVSATDEIVSALENGVVSSEELKSMVSSDRKAVECEREKAA